MADPADNVRRVDPRSGVRIASSSLGIKRHLFDIAPYEELTTTVLIVMTKKFVEDTTSVASGWTDTAASCLLVGTDGGVSIAVSPPKNLPLGYYHIVTRYKAPRVRGVKGWAPLYYTYHVT